MKSISNGIAKSLDEIKNFFERESMYRVLRATLRLIIGLKDVIFRLNIGGGSYTNGHELVVGLPQPLFKATFKEMYISLLALLGHEAQHIMSSNFKEFGIYNEEETEKLVRKGYSRNFAQKLVHSVGNCIEDGRIERILVNKFPGFLSKIQFLNMYFWELSEMDEETNEFQALISTILTLSVLGIYPKGYKKVFAGTRLDKEVDKVKDLVIAGTKARTCKNGLDICRKILNILEPYIRELYEDIRKDEEMMQMLMEMLQELQDSSNFNNSEEVDKNDKQEHSSHMSIPSPQSKKDEKEEGESSSGSSSKKNKDEEKDEDIDKENSSGSGSKSDDKDENKDEASSSSSEDEENGDTSKDSEEDKNSNGSSGGSEEEEDDDKKDEEKNNDKKGLEEEKDGDTDNKDKDGDEKSDSSEDEPSNGENSETKENNETTALSQGVDTPTDDKAEALTEDEISRKMKEISEGLMDEADNAFKEADKWDRTNKPLEDGKALTPEEERDLRNKYGRGFEFREIANNFPLTYELPPEIRIPAKQFKKEIENIFKNKAMLSVYGQHKGLLNTDDLYRVGIEEYNVFTVEGIKSNSDYVAYILQDGSGSMNGDKELNSAYALSIIEEGLKGVIPFKLTTFTASAMIDHYVVKNWNSNSKKNYAYNFLRYRRASGGNEDGYSIRVATKELLKRPEKDRILIVLSDGLPSNVEDTRLAIKEARENNIFVVGIMFGSEKFRNDNYEAYRYMYQKNIISTAPKGIPKKLTDILKKILVR